jgi:hyperosmotically inducible protein
VVKLAGDTNTSAEQTRAIEIARAVKGVKDVVSEMRISDTAIVNNVKKALTADEMLAKVPIDVDSSDGYVRLMSAATNRDERQRALEVAKTIEGVASVEDRMK